MFRHEAHEVIFLSISPISRMSFEDGLCFIPALLCSDLETIEEES